MRFSGDIAYTYQVDQGDWSQPTGEESIRFSEMEAGVHRILLRSISRSSQTVLDQITVNVNVAEPWWNSSAMWAVYFLLIVLIFWAMTFPKWKEKVPAVAYVGLAAVVGVVFRMVD